MTAAARIGWAAGALFFATLSASIVRVDYVWLFPELLLAGFAVLAAVRPAIALHLLAAAVPIARYTFAQRWNPSVPWGETVVCAALAGLCANQAIAHRGTLPFALRAPALVFGAIVVAAVIAALGVPALRLGPGFRDAIATQLLREYFIDSRGFPALHTGMLLIEGMLLLAISARIAAQRDRGLLAGIVAATVIGATVASVMNLEHLWSAASRRDDFWAGVVQLSRTVRWNVHYADFNAAGSYFAMAALAAFALAVTARAAPARIAWMACTVVITLALWLTASRAAYLAAIVAAAGAAGTVWLLRSGRRLVAGAAIAAATAAIVLAIAVAAPMRGNQHSSSVAAGVRLGMAAVAARMIASHPVFGIGPGEFYQRSGEFATPELIATFPVAVHENAHNNFLQVAAELGLVGGAAFSWVVVAAFATTLRGAAADRFRLLVAAGLGAFVISWLGGHPLLVPEPGFAFWILMGVAAGSGARAAPEAQVPSGESPGRRRADRAVIAAVVVIILATVPWRMRALMQAADLEHIGIGVSLWQLSPDDRRYRQAEGHATLFVPTGAFRFSVNPRSDGPIRLEVVLDGRTADIVTLAPRVWNDLALPGRTERTSARFATMELRVRDGDEIGIWITKVEPIR